MDNNELRTDYNLIFFCQIIKNHFIDLKKFNDILTKIQFFRKKMKVSQTVWPSHNQTAALRLTPVGIDEVRFILNLEFFSCFQFFISAFLYVF